MYDYVIPQHSQQVIRTTDISHWRDAQKLPRPKGKAAYREQCRQSLLASIKPGDTIYTILRHVSRSGMRRHIDLYLMTADGPLWLSGLAAGACDWALTNRGNTAIIADGCGMDMGFHLVYSLSRTLFRESFDCIGKDCPSNDHSNGDRNREPHMHSDGGFALRHKWM